MDEIDEIIIPKSTLIAIAHEKKKIENDFFQKIYFDNCNLLLEFIENEKIENIKTKTLIDKWEKFKEQKAIKYIFENHKNLIDQINFIINSSNLKKLNFDYFKKDNQHLNKIELKFLNQTEIKLIEYTCKDDWHLIPIHLHEFIYFLNCNIANLKNISYSDEQIKLCRKIFDIDAKDNLDPIYQC